MSETWLSPDEVAELTDRKRWTAQCRKLSEMGVPFKPNAVGRPLVARVLYAQADAQRRNPKEPDWSALRGKAA